MKIQEAMTSNQKEWDTLAELDPYWFILKIRGKKGRWKTSELFKTGWGDVNNLLSFMDKYGLPKERNNALDFGCGVGRVTVHLAPHFKRTYGLDISKKMIAKAKESTKIKNCRFILNPSNNLSIFRDEYFDLVYSNLVLQHVPDNWIIKGYIKEFIRILNKGGLLVFQLPSKVPFRRFNKIINNLYFLIEKILKNKKFMYRKLNLYKITLNSLNEKEVIETINKNNAKTLKIKREKINSLYISNTYFVTK